MRLFLLCVMIVLLPLSSVWALDLDAACSNVEPYCKVVWIPNTEPDMKEYRLFLRQLPASFDLTTPSLVIPHPASNVPNVTGALGLSQNGDYGIVVMAVDNADNESGPSNERKFHYTIVDLPPNAPEIEITIGPAE